MTNIVDPISHSSAAIAAALKYVEIGLKPIPVPNGEKAPIVEWKDLNLTAEQIPVLFAGPCNIAVRLSDNFADIDLDCAEAVALAPAFLPDTGWVHGRKSNPASHYVYGLSEPTKTVKRQINSAMLCELKTGNNLVNCPPSVHPTGEAYEFVQGKSADPSKVKSADLCRRFNLLATATVLCHAWPKTKGARHQLALAIAGGLLRLCLSPDEARQVIGQAAKLAGDKEWQDRVTAVTTTATKMKAKEPATGWPEAAKIIDDKTVGAIRKWWNDGDGGDNAALSFHALNDDGNADALVQAHGDDLRYDHDRKTWLVWGGHRWCEDRDCEAERRFTAVMKALELEAIACASGKKNPRASHYSRSRNTHWVKAGLAAAQTKHRFATLAPQYDADPWLFGTANGVIELKTGKFRPGQREDMISKGSPVEFHPAAKCPRFEQFVSEIYGGDKILIDFIWRWCGYSLTGVVDEELMTLHIGGGANGKSTLLKVLSHVMGDYAGTLPPNALDRAGSQRTSEYVAAVFGRRLITLSEVGVSAAFNEQLLKVLVSRDKISGRNLYRRAFEFLPTHKIMFAMNNAPDVADDSAGFWRRVAVIPYGVTFPGDEALEEQLKSEAAGILAWMVCGCSEWQKRPLKPLPDVVRSATEDYKQGEDQLAEFFEARCVVGEGQKVPQAVIWKSYGYWAEANSVAPAAQVKKKAFMARLKKMFKLVKNDGVMVFHGVGLKHNIFGTAPAIEKLIEQV